MLSLLRRDLHNRKGRFFAMVLSESVLSLARIIYPLREPPKHRSKELEVLCLGLPRSGTDSLQNALRTLGYGNVAHGFVWAQHAEISETYYRLRQQLLSGKVLSAEVLRSEYFDRVLGDCDASTDVPPAWFAAELLAAYPTAKVVLNRRRDVAAWKESFRKAVLPFMQSWSYWWASWFNAELFWINLLTYEMHGKCLFKGDFEKNAEVAYVRHYENLEKIMRQQGREWLDWSVEEGWEPLCEFLEKPVPEENFPSGNVAADFIPTLMKNDAKRFRDAKRNAAIVAAVVAVFGAATFARFSIS